jgi:uncharacterized membrane protein
MHNVKAADFTLHGIGRIDESMTSAGATTRSPAGRIAAVDTLRGLALIAMTAFHFLWDLEMFGMLPAGFMAEPGPVWAARIIASTFLFLVGVSLVLAHGAGIRATAFAWRLAQVGAAAAAISIATRIATPDSWIFFGILHLIALGSLAGLAFLRLPGGVTILAGIAVVAIGARVSTPALDSPLWWWTGLSQFIPRSNDYVPVFPYFGAILIGIGVARIAMSRHWIAAIARAKLADPASRALRLLGRHSLLYYLLHQPVMIGFLYIILLVI